MRDKLKQMSIGAAAAVHGALTDRLSLVAAALYASVVATLVSAQSALAQSSGGGGGEIESALQSAVDWFSGIIVTAGILGILICAVAWIFFSLDERKRKQAAGAAAGCVFAIFLGLMAPAIVGLLESWAPSSGGGGGA